MSCSKCEKIRKNSAIIARIGIVVVAITFMMLLAACGNRGLDGFWVDVRHPTQTIEFSGNWVRFDFASGAWQSGTFEILLGDRIYVNWNRGENQHGVPLWNFRSETVSFELDGNSLHWGSRDFTRATR